MENMLIGREREKGILHEITQSQESEFVAIYGRRRIGKTFLVRKYFKNIFAFYMTGVDNITMQEQLINFSLALNKYTQKDNPVPKNWFYAFDALQNYLETLPDGDKVVFIDEMPWLDTPRSKFVNALEHFWNSWATQRNDIKLIACGSATSWMLNELVNSRGGLHNRLTRKILLEPFTLKECKQYFDAKKMGYSQRDIAECYMVMGGVPFYLKQMQKKMSVAQNIDALFFKTGALLADEYSNLMRSLFKHSANYFKIIELLSQKGIGLSRLDILSGTGLVNNGGLTQMLNELQTCGFIREYLPIGKEKKTTLYQIIDPFLLFHFRFIQNNKYQNEHFWMDTLSSPMHDSWAGYAFEVLCLNHLRQIKNALGISGVECRAASWRSEKTKGGAQIDLLIDRNDNVVNVCEMKFSKRAFTISAKYENDLMNKIDVFREETCPQKTVRLTMITASGVSQNKHSGIIQNELKLQDLFE